MPSDPIPPLATDNLELEGFIDQSCSESELDGSPRHRILIPPSMSTMPQDCPVPFESDSDLIRPFPVEVFEHIIDQSDDLDGSLCRLSLTCRAFLPRARVNLFFRIHIGHKEKLESAPAFLEAWSWLPPLVHAVIIRDYFNRDPFMLHAVVPSRLIAMLPRLHSLEFERDARNRAGDLGDNPRSQYAGLAYSPSVLSILRKTYAAIQHLELTGVMFETIADFLRLLCTLPRLKSLVCDGSTSFESDGDISLVKDKPLHLTCLVVEWIWRERALQMLLDMSRATLENLTMCSLQFATSGYVPIHRPDREPTTMPTISQHGSLRILTLEASSVKELDYASEILDSVLMTGALQRLNVVMPWEVLAPLAFNAIDVSDRRALKTLEESIIRLSLKHVVFYPLHVRKNRRSLWNPAVDHVFPALKASGALRQKTQVYSASERLSHSSGPGTVMGHDRAVSSLIVSPDGKFFASSSDDGTIILWDTLDGTIVHEWIGHSGPCRSLAFSPDSRYLLSGGDDGNSGNGTLKVWDILDGSAKELRVLDLATPGGRGIFQYAWSADGMWLATIWPVVSGHGTDALPDMMQIQVWDVQTFRLHHTFEEHCSSQSSGRAMAFSPDSQWLAWPSKSSEGDAYYIWVGDILAPDASPRIPLHKDELRSLSFDPSSTRLATAQHHYLRIWDIVTGTSVAVMKGHTGYVESVVFSPDGRYVLSASRDGTARVWLAESGECTQSFKEHGNIWIMQALFSPNRNYILTALLGDSDGDGTVRLWRMEDGSCVATFTDHEPPVRHIMFSPDGQTLASGDDIGVVRIRDVSHITGQ